MNVNGGLAMYCGYLKLYRRSGEEGGEEGELYWRTVVEVSSDSNLIGGVQERKVVFEEMERKKKKSGGDSGSGGDGGGGQQEEEKSYYMILEPKQDWIMEVCNILEFLFFFSSFPADCCWLAGVGWIGFDFFFPFLPILLFSLVFPLIWGKWEWFFFLTLNSPTLQLTNQKKFPSEEYNRTEQKQERFSSGRSLNEFFLNHLPHYSYSPPTTSILRYLPPNRHLHALQKKNPIVFSVFSFQSQRTSQPAIATQKNKK